MEGYTKITVTGTNFDINGMSDFKCKFGMSLSPYNITVINSTTLTCRAARTDIGLGSFIIMAPETNTYVESAVDVVTYTTYPSLFVSETRHHQIFRFNADSGEFVDVFIQPGNGGLKNPTALTIGPDLNMYVASQGTSSVLQFDGSSGKFIKTFCTVPGKPRGLVFHGGLEYYGNEGSRNVNITDLFVTSEMLDRVYRYNALTGSPRGVYIDDEDRLDMPSGITFDPYTDMAYVASQDTGHINRYVNPGGFYAGRHAEFDEVWTKVRTPLISAMQLTVDSMYTVGPRPGKAFVRYNRSNGEYLHHFEDEELVDPTDIKEYKDYIYIVCQSGVRKYNRLNGEYIRTHAVANVNTTGTDVEFNAMFFHKVGTPSMYLDPHREDHRPPPPPPPTSPAPAPTPPPSGNQT